MKPYKRRVTPVEVRLWRKVDTSAGPDGCWPFTGALRNGYGALGAGRSDEGLVYAHRISYLDRVGPIPDGFQIDHLCRNRACCNPAHLEAVTQTVNLQRQAEAAVANRTLCKRGIHPWTPNNILQTKSQRYCRSCMEDRKAAA